MEVLVIDGQGGKLGRELVEQITKAHPEVTLTAVGTNSLATESMMKGGARRVATGENAVIVNCRYADIIVGPVGIVIADSIWGEVTPAMALAVGQSQAKRILIPVNLCNNVIVGASGIPMSKLVQSAAEAAAALLR